jgi:PadR family transcriptional regulator PadR
MDDLTAFQRDIIYVVAGNDNPHGLAIKEALDDYYNEDINHGRLYPNLDDLVDLGLIEKGERDRRTNEYELTDRGVRELTARREFEDELVEEVLEDPAEV